MNSSLEHKDKTGCGTDCPRINSSKIRSHFFWGGGGVRRGYKRSGAWCDGCDTIGAFASIDLKSLNFI